MSFKQVYNAVIWAAIFAAAIGILAFSTPAATAGPRMQAKLGRPANNGLPRSALNVPRTVGMTTGQNVNQIGMAARRKTANNNYAVFAIKLNAHRHLYSVGGKIRSKRGLGTN